MTDQFKDLPEGVEVKQKPSPQYCKAAGQFRPTYEVQVAIANDEVPAIFPSLLDWEAKYIIDLIKRVRELEALLQEALPMFPGGSVASNVRSKILAALKQEDQ